MRNHHSSSVLVGDHLYGFSSAILTAMKFDTGEVAWRDRSVGKGSLVFADDRLYLYSEGGTVGLAEANPTGYREHGRFELKTGRPADVEPSGRLWRQALPAGSGHDLRLRRQGEVAPTLDPDCGHNMRMALAGHACATATASHVRSASEGAAKEGKAVEEVLADTRLKIAVFIDFDNIEIGVKSTLGSQFESASSSKRSRSAATSFRRSPTATGRARATTAGR